MGLFDETNTPSSTTTTSKNKKTRSSLPGSNQSTPLNLSANINTTSNNSNNSNNSNTSTPLSPIPSLSLLGSPNLFSNLTLSPPSPNPFSGGNLLISNPFSESSPSSLLENKNITTPDRPLSIQPPPPVDPSKFVFPTVKTSFISSLYAPTTIPINKLYNNTLDRKSDDIIDQLNNSTENSNSNNNSSSNNINLFETNKSFNIQLYPVQYDNNFDIIAPLHTFTTFKCIFCEKGVLFDDYKPHNMYCDKIPRTNFFNRKRGEIFGGYIYHDDESKIILPNTIVTIILSKLFKFTMNICGNKLFSYFISAITLVTKEWNKKIIPNILKSMEFNLQVPNSVINYHDMVIKKNYTTNVAVKYNINRKTFTLLRDSISRISIPFQNLYGFLYGTEEKRPESIIHDNSDPKFQRIFRSTQTKSILLKNETEKSNLFNSILKMELLMYDISSESLMKFNKLFQDFQFPNLKTLDIKVVKVLDVEGDDNFQVNTIDVKDLYTPFDSLVSLKLLIEPHITKYLRLWNLEQPLLVRKLSISRMTVPLKSIMEMIQNNQYTTSLTLFQLTFSDVSSQRETIDRLYRVLSSNLIIRKLKLYHHLYKINFKSAIDLINQNSTLQRLDIDCSLVTKGQYQIQQPYDIYNQTLEFLQFKVFGNPNFKIYEYWVVNSKLSSINPLEFFANGFKTTNLSFQPLFTQILNYHMSNLRSLCLYVQREDDATTLESLYNVVLLNSPRLTHLKVSTPRGQTPSSKNIPLQFLQGFFPALEKNTHIQHIEFAGMGCPMSFMSSFLEFNHPSIKSFQSEYISQFKLIHFSKLMQANKSLLSLQLNYVIHEDTVLTDEDLKQFFKIFKFNHNLERLIIPMPLFPQCPSKNLIYNFLQCIVENSSINTLVISNNGSEIFEFLIFNLITYSH